MLLPETIPLFAEGAYRNRPDGAAEKAFLSNAFVGIVLRGHQMTVTNAHLLANDLSTGGRYPKAWVRKEDGFYLYKDGSIRSSTKGWIESN